MKKKINSNSKRIKDFGRLRTYPGKELIITTYICIYAFIVRYIQNQLPRQLRPGLKISHIYFYRSLIESSTYSTMLFATILLAITITCVHSQTELTLPPLPYEYNALEPVLSEELMRLHHDEHFQTYTNQTNTALKALYNDTHYDGQFQNISGQPIEVILTRLKTLPDVFHIALRHYGGGYLNHKLFFSILRTPTATAAENQPTGPLLEAIKRSFGSYEKFHELFTAAAVNLFGSGWVWLYVDARSKHLVINYTANQDNP